MPHPKAEDFKWIHEAKEVSEKLHMKWHSNHHGHPADEKSSHHQHGHHKSSLLAEKAEAGTGATRILHELGTAEQAVMKELANAPELRREEFSLLSKAEDAAHRAADAKVGFRNHRNKSLALLRKKLALTKRAKKAVAKATATTSLAAEFKEGEHMIHNYATALNKELKDGRKVIKETNMVKGKVAEALAEVHADRSTTLEIEGLMAKAMKFEKKEVAIEAKSFAETRHQEVAYKAMEKRSLSNARHMMHAHKKAKAAAKVSVADELKQGGKMLRRYVAESKTEIKKERKTEQSLKAVNSKVAAALREVHEDPSTAREVEGFLAKALKFQRREVSLESKSLGESKKMETAYDAMAKRTLKREHA